MAERRESGDLGTGERVARIRVRRGLTQEQLAQRAGVNVSTLRKLEQGGRETCSLETLHKLALGLGVTTSQLFRPASSLAEEARPDRAHPELFAVRQALFPARALPGLATDPIAEVPSVASVRRSLAAAAALLRDNRYAETIAAVPSLLAEARITATQSTGDERQAALSVLAEACLVTASVLTHLRHEDLAAHALGQALDTAERAGDQLMAANAIVAQGWILIRQGRFAEVRRTCVATADAIEPRMSAASADALVTWGWLLLRASAAAARDACPDEAADLMRMAAGGAALLPRQRPTGCAGIGEFTPAIVAMKSVENAVVADRPDQALALAQTVPAAGRSTSDNRNRFLLDRASALVAVRKHDEALRTVLDVRAAAPQWLRRQDYARRVAAKLVRSSKRGLSEDLRDLCDFLRVDCES